MLFFRDVIVPILLEPIQKRHVTEKMVSLFATQTYIKWPQRDERQRREFWVALIKALRPRKAKPVYEDEKDDFITSPDEP